MAIFFLQKGHLSKFWGGKYPPYPPGRAGPDTEYTQDDLSDLVAKLNILISVQPKKNMKTVRSKYSHIVFFGVAKIPASDILAM